MAQASPVDFSPTHPTNHSLSPSTSIPPNRNQLLSPTSLSPHGASNNFHFNTFQSGASQQHDHINGDIEPNIKQGTMGPPSKPPVVNAASLTDVLEASGINVAEEESFLFQSLNPNASFASARSGVSGSQTLSANNSFNDLSQLTNGSHGAYFAQSGSLASSSAPPSSAEELVLEEQRHKARRRAEKLQFHLNKPFVEGLTLRKKLLKSAMMSGVVLPEHEYQHSDYPAVRDVRSTSLRGPDGSAITQVSPGFILPKESLLGDIIAILSIAANERLRNFAETAFAVSKGRQSYSQGEIPLEWSDIAVSTTGEPSSGGKPRAGVEQATSPQVTSNKRPAPDSTPFPNVVANALRDRQARDYSAEEIRQRKRVKRANTSAPTGPSTPASSGGLLGDRAPEAEPKKLTKKEQAKMASARHDETHQAKVSNATLAHVLGGNKKKYSWMSSAAPSGGPKPGDAIGRAGGGLGVGGSAGGGAVGSGATTPRSLGIAQKRWGEWKENGAGTTGVQLRDWIAALELDDHVQKPLSKARMRLNY